VNTSHVVVDTNVLFASLLRRQTKSRQVLLSRSQHIFYSPRFVVVEIFKHKERIVAATELNEDELLEFLNTSLSRIRFVDEGVIPIGTWMEGRRLCGGVDPKDSPFVTLTLHVDGLLWTLDSELETALRSKGFNRFFMPAQNL
jgi:predicted nucleic acid-binding protein